METYTGLEQFKPIPQDTKIQNGDTGNHQDLPPTRGVSDNRFQGCLLPHTNTGTIQEISEISFHKTYQFKPLPFGLSTASMEFTVIARKGGETDGHTQGYKNPPVPRRLVGESQVPPNLSPAYTGSSENVSGFGLAGEFRKIRTGAQTYLRLCRLPVRPQVWLGPIRTRPVAEPSRKITDTTIPTALSGPATHVLDRSANSHREISSPRLTA